MSKIVTTDKKNLLLCYLPELMEILYACQRDFVSEKNYLFSIWLESYFLGLSFTLICNKFWTMPLDFHEWRLS